MNRQITNFMNESDCYIAPEVEMVELEANNVFLQALSGGGSPGTGGAEPEE